MKTPAGRKNRSDAFRNHGAYSRSDRENRQIRVAMEDNQIRRPLKATIPPTNGTLPRPPGETPPPPPPLPRRRRKIGLAEAR